MKSRVRNAFTLIEILIVVVIMAILAATIIPQFTDSTGDAEVATAEFNVNTLRSQIELYKAQHGGALPAYNGTTKNIDGLTTQTTHNGKNYGPYMVMIPENSVNGLSTVKESTTSGGIALADVDGLTGWIYHTGLGEVRINHASHWQK